MLQSAVTTVDSKSEYFLDKASRGEIVVILVTLISIVVEIAVSSIPANITNVQRLRQNGSMIKNVQIFAIILNHAYQ